MTNNIFLILSILSIILGCVSTAPDTYPHTCSESDKTNKICTSDYRPSCGWFGKNVFCLKYPCAANASNICNACTIQNVEYVTEGLCPTTPPVVSEPIPTPPVVSKPAPTQIYPYFCQEEDYGKMCTREYIGVCGWYNDLTKCKNSPCNITGATVCQLCSTHNDIKYVTLGECSIKAQTTILVNSSLPGENCTQEEKKAIACTMEYTPTCGWYGLQVQCLVYPCAGNFGNRCSACAAENVESTTNGDCPKTGSNEVI